MKEQLTNKSIMLAPLAGVSDVSFRIICEKYGADKTFTEMISVKALYYNNKRTEELMFISDKEKNCNIQLFGKDPDIIAKVVKEKINPLTNIDEISFNMGCPASKIIKNGEGSALLKEPSLVREICEALVESSNKKVNIKYRLGFDKDHINFIKIGRIAEKAGIDYLVLHARTTEMMYSGKADWQKIKELKDEVNIPVIANGDIFSVEDFVSVIEKTGADGVMLARAAMGNPFLFKEIKDYIKYGSYKKPSPQEIIDQLVEQYKLSLEFKRDDLVLAQMRKHVGWYIKGLENSTKIREEVNKLKSKEEIFDLLEKYKESLEG